MADRKGILVVISGFSGAGKGTVMKGLMEKYPGYALSVSVTTRAPRDYETEGVEYFFRSREQFEELIRGDALIEYAEYQGNYYGTPKAYVEDCLQRGQDVILEIEMVGAHIVKEKFPESVLIFITPPDFDQLRERLMKRGTETPEQIEGRLKRASEEADVMLEYDYIALNHDGQVEACVDHIHGIITSEHSRAVRNKDFIEEIRKDAGRS